MMTKKKLSSIANLGLQRYLDETQVDHNWLGYYHFKLFLEKRVAQTAMSRLFGVNYRTIIKWINIYKENNREK